MEFPKDLPNDFTAEFDSLQRKDWELWVLAVSVILALGAFILVLFFYGGPDVFPNIGLPGSEYRISILTLGLTGLLLLFIAYVMVIQHRLKKMQRAFLRERLYAETLRLRLLDYQMILKVSTLVNSSQDLPEIFNAIVRALVEFLRCDEASIYIYNRKHDLLECKAAFGYQNDALFIDPVVPGKGVVGWVMQKGQPLLLQGLIDGQKFEDFVVKSRDIASSMSLPLKTKERTIGVLNINRITTHKAFTEADLKLASILAENAAAAFDVRMQQKEKLDSLTILAGGIAHDFNNLLTGIIGFADITLMDLPADSPVRANLQEILSSATRAADLTSQMLAYAGHAILPSRPMDLNLLVEQTIQTCREGISEGCRIQFKPDPKLPIIKAEVAQVGQIIRHLVQNAIESLPEEGGDIEVLTGVRFADRAFLDTCHLGAELNEGDYIYLEVRDTGIGMDDQVQARMFDPFYTTKFLGRGLGLASVWGILRTHGGAIRVFSTPEQGSDFLVLFSAMEATPALARRDGTESSSDNPIIIVIDDDSGIRSLIYLALSRMGYEVLTAATGEEGISQFQRHAPQTVLVILGAKLVGMGEGEALQALRAIKSDVRAILVSGSSNDEALEQHGDKGWAGFLQKPFRSTDLVEKVREVLS